MKKLAAAVVLAITLTTNQCEPPKQQPKPSSTKKCQEDDPCWNCKTMGNKRCGPPGDSKRL